MTWECPNCGRSYPDSSLGLPHGADADQKLGCVECIDNESPNYGQNGVELVLGLIDHTERNGRGKPVTYWTRYALDIHTLARTDNRQFWELATKEMGASVISKYREDAEDPEL
jgi:hypothetical protein